MLVDVYYSNCNANEPTFPSLPLSVSLFSSLWTLHFSSLFIFSSSPSIPLDTNITITYIPYSYPRHLTPTTPIPHHICPWPNHNVRKDRQKGQGRSNSSEYVDPYWKLEIGSDSRAGSIRYVSYFQHLSADVEQAMSALQPTSPVVRPHARSYRPSTAIRQSQ